MEWYVAVHSSPKTVPATIEWRFRDKYLNALRLDGGDLTAPLSVTFDEAIATIQSWDCLLTEPDGSLVWATPEWRIDAQLQDGRDGLQYVELKTTAPRVATEKLLTAFGHPNHALVIQLIYEGVFLDATTWLELLELDLI